ncbi:MAG: hypothetical protein ACJ76V_02765 [Thermoleophilaceae bacterium]
MLRTRTAVAILCALILGALVAPASGAAKPVEVGRILHAQLVTSDSVASAAARKHRRKAKKRRLVLQRTLIPHHERYVKFKRRAARHVRRVKRARSPVFGRISANAIGLNQPGLVFSDTPVAWRSAPANATGAVGPNNYVEMTNSAVKVFKKSDLTLDSGAGKLGSMAMNDFVGASNREVTYPQIQWDPVTQRWYYLALYVEENKDASHPGKDALAFGWSKTSDPNVPPSGSNSATGWCRYIVDTGVSFDDFPKLGNNDTRLIVGANSFADNDPSSDFQTAHVFTISKPTAGTGCSTNPELKQFGTAASPLPMKNGAEATTPVPVYIPQSSANGYVLAADDPGTHASLKGTRIMEWHVDPTGNLHDDTSSNGLFPVADYQWPGAAAQGGSSNWIDTLDARLTQAVGVTDPTSGVGALALWTQHTILSGASGAQVRWYELVPSQCNRTGASLCTGGVRQTGNQTPPASTWYFNGAVTPTLNGDQAVLIYNSAGNATTTTRSTVKADSRISTDAVGTMPGTEQTVVTSGDSVEDSSCGVGAGDPCAWGYYAGAAPDTSVGSANKVWASNMYTAARNGTTPAWVTRNFSFTP